VIVAGLSNEEFASTLRSIPYPFTTNVANTGIEIYHGSDGQFETRAPVRTFTTVNIGNQQRLLAAYTCTPLVDLALSELTPGAQVRGKTIAELGNGNRPIDMIVYQKDGSNFLLMANSSRGVMKIGIDNLDRTESITSPVSDDALVQSHENLSLEDISTWTGIAHLDRLDNAHALVLHNAGGSMNLETRLLP
jgi:hypothetical protein